MFMWAGSHDCLPVNIRCVCWRRAVVRSGPGLMTVFTCESRVFPLLRWTTSELWWLSGG